MRSEANAMLKIARIMEALDPDERRRVAFYVHRTYGGPLTSAERMAMHRQRAAETRDENTLPGTENTSENTPENTSDAPSVSPTPPVVGSSSSASKDKQQQIQENAKEVLAFLNEKTGRSYRPVEENLRFIRARLATATVQECKGVIARKTRAWSGTEQAVYLRPKTLFNATNFEQYLGEREAPRV